MSLSRTAFALIPGMVLVLALTPRTASADAVYTYTGYDFTQVESPYSTSDFLSISITFMNPLPANLGVPTGGGPQVAVDESADVLSWTATDQINTLTPSNSVFSQPDFGTDAQGNIDLWNLGFSNTPPPPSVPYTAINSDGSSGTVGLDESTTIESESPYDQPAGYAYGIGSWQNASPGPATPEPSTSALVSLSGAALLWAVKLANRRRFIRAKF